MRMEGWRMDRDGGRRHHQTRRWQDCAARQGVLQALRNSAAAQSRLDDRAADCDKPLRRHRERTLTPGNPIGRRICGNGGRSDHHGHRILWCHVPDRQASMRDDRCCKTTWTRETGPRRRAHVEMARACAAAARSRHGDDLAPRGRSTRSGGGSSTEHARNCAGARGHREQNS